MTGARSLTALAVAAVVAGALQAPAAAAAGQAPGLAPVMLVLDASGSMRDALPGGRTKMVAAKEAVGTLVRQSPDGAQVGLAVYGTGTGNAPADKPAGCQDVKVVRKVGPLDRAALTATVAGLQARGYTPIGRSLQVAAAELPAAGPRSIVLVSDGVDTCAPPDPCAVARELASHGVDLRVHAIGFAVDANARRQLSCLAQATGGTYIDAPDAGSLAAALNRTTQQALRAYQPTGIRVTGTIAPAGAPALRAGRYLDQLGPNEAKFYTVNVPAGYTLYANATAVLRDPGEHYFVEVSRYDAAANENCIGRGSDDNTGPVATALTRWQAPGPSTPTANPDSAPCSRAGTQLLRVFLEPIFKTSDVAGAAIEVLIGLEPPLTGNPGPPGTTDRVVFNAPAGAPRPVVGGGSFSTAATLDGSGSYTETVFEGEMVFYRVRLGWGQGLAYRVRLGRHEYHGTGGGFLVHTFWYNPAQEPQDEESTSYNGAEVLLPTSSGAISGPPVRYRNRQIDEVKVGASVAGWYYVAFYAAKDLSEEPTPVPLTLDLTVSGNAQPAPAYAGAAADAFGNQAPTGARGSAAPAGADRGVRSVLADGGRLLWVGVAILLVLALLVSGLLALAVRHQRRKAPAVPPWRPPSQPPPWR